MRRQVRSKIGWNEGSDNKIADRTGLFRIIRNVLGGNHRASESTSSTGIGCIEGFKAQFGFASVKEAETLLRRARMLQ